jgi:acetyl/propionyl-CoA carboxylase alpha subunit
MALIAKIDGKALKAEVLQVTGHAGHEIFEVQIGKKTHTVDVGWLGSAERFSMIVDGRSYDVDVIADGDELMVTLAGTTYRVKLEDELMQKMLGQAKERSHAAEVTLKAPMPGMVVGVEVSEGQVVTAGQGLVILEAMKMQNELKAPKPGTVKTVRVKPGDKVNGSDVLLVIGQ